MTKEDIEIRKYFPILDNENFTYVDNSATTQKPKCVIDAIKHYYEESNANPMRGLYDLSIKATDLYEDARKEVADFIKADRNEIVFTRNATESLNLIAYSYGLNFLKEGDEIIISVMEHHSNMLPWQMVAKKTKATLTYIYPDKDGELSPSKLKEKISNKTKIVSITHVSNVYGRVNDVKEFAKIAHSVGALISVD